MKKIISLLFTVFLVIIPNCIQPPRPYGDKPQPVIIAGKIDNYEPNWQVIIGVNRIGFTPDLITAKTDSAGNFKATFESYIPLDAWITYKTNFLVLLHPGDSLFVQFDGIYNDSPELLKSIVFGGDAAEKNRYAAIFQQMCFSSASDWDTKRKAVKEYDVEQYLQYLDTLQQKCTTIYEQFVAENSPDDESRNWARLLSEKDYYHYLGWYVNNRRQTNLTGWNDTWDVPRGFYDRLCNRLPIEPSMLVSAYALNDFTDVFSRYVNDRLRDRTTGVGWHVFPGGILSGSPEIVDSVKIYSTIEFVSDPLLRQIMLTRFFHQNFEIYNFAVYKRFRDVADQYIKEPFLREPLVNKYLQYNKN